MILLIGRTRDGRGSRPLEDLRHAVVVNHSPVVGVCKEVGNRVPRREQDPLDLASIQDLQRVLQARRVEKILEHACVFNNVGAAVDESLDLGLRLGEIPSPAVVIEHPLACQSV